MPRKSKNIECYKCGGRHFANECETRCHRCGGPHYVSNCPRSSRTPAKRQKKAPCEEMKVKELQLSLKERGLPVSGRKADLVARLQTYFIGQTKTLTTASAARPRSGVVAARPSVAVATVYALFDVEDDPNDAAMANAVSTFELSQSPHTSVNNDAPPPGADSKPAAATKGTVTAHSSGLLSQSTTSLSLSQPQQTSHTSQTSSVSSSATKKTELTQEQKERMRRSREEAHKKKMARLSAVNRSQSPSSAARSLSQSPPKKKGTTIIINPYLQKSPTMKRDESKPDDAILFGCGQWGDEWSGPIKTLDYLPPLPPDAPPVREDTLNRLSEQQLEVIMAARPPPPNEAAVVDDKNMAAAKDRMDDNENTSCVKKIVSTPKKQATNTKSHPNMVRVNAAAGTGKTTTLIHLASRCIDLGHTSLTYVTYSRASANDAQDRMQAVLDKEHKGCVAASTLHSCAMRLLNLEPLEEQEEEGGRVLDDVSFQNWMKEQWGEDLEEYIEQAVHHVRSTTREEEEHKLDGKEKLLYDKASFLLFKTFQNFTRKKMSLEVLKDPKGWGRDYWPIKKPGGEFHEGGAAAKLGFPPNIYSLESSYTFYADLCVKIWAYVVKYGIRTFDIEIKKAQLNQLCIPCSVLLVDECQDLDECQVDWIEGQKQFGTHIFFVGDSAQCIYGFRGAKSSCVMKIDCIDTKLTKSWRFGPNIAKVANISLFAKEKSEQTTENSGKKRLWIPYRVQGARREEGEEGGVVTTKSLLEDWQNYKPLVLIGRNNSGLMIKAMDLLGLGGLKNPTVEDGDSLVSSIYGESRSCAEDELTSAMIGTMENLPKFHINGKGGTSGTQKWRKATRQIRHLYELFTNRDETGYLPMTLPATEFKDFANEGPVTWGSFIEICQVKEIGQYDMALIIVSTYQQNTLKAMNIFESHVMANQCSEEEADIILTTCHSAKGLEWNHVEICDDMLDLSAASFADSLSPTLHHPSFLKAMPGQIKSETPSTSLETSKGDKRKGWQFILSKFKDEHINLLYVASTRAKKTLSVPRSIKTLLQEFDMLHYLVGTFKKDASGADGRRVPLSKDESMMMMGKIQKKLNKGEVWNLYYDLCYPLRKELEVADDCMILPSLFPDCENESMEHKLEGEQGEFEVKVKPEEQPDITMPGNENIADFFEDESMENKFEREQGESKVKPEG